MVRLEGFVSNCNKEVHGSGAGWLLGWYTEVCDLKLRRIAERVNLLERSECGRPTILKKEKEINALSHGYSRGDCRGNERNAATDRGAGRPVGGGTPPWRKPRQNGTGVGQADDATSTAASHKVGGHKVNRPPVKLRQRRGEELGEEPSQCGRGRCKTTSSVYSQIFGNRLSGRQ